MAGNVPIRRMLVDFSILISRTTKGSVRLGNKL
jgi:hypothetical protein